MKKIFTVQTAIFSMYLPFLFCRDLRLRPLNDINANVLTASIAKKYFGNENPIGKVLDIDDWEPHTGIAKFVLTLSISLLG